MLTPKPVQLLLSHHASALGLPPSVLELLPLGKASHHAMRTLKHPCREALRCLANNQHQLASPVRVPTWTEILQSRLQKNEAPASI